MPYTLVPNNNMIPLPFYWPFYSHSTDDSKQPQICTPTTKKRFVVVLFQACLNLSRACSGKFFPTILLTLHLFYWRFYLHSTDRSTDHSTLILLIILLPLYWAIYYHSTPILLTILLMNLLPIYSHSTPNLLPFYSQSTCTPILLPIYSQSTPILLPIYSHSSPNLLPIYSHSTPNLLPFYSTPNLLIIVLPFSWWLNTILLMILLPFYGSFYW